MSHQITTLLRQIERLQGGAASSDASQNSEHQLVLRGQGDLVTANDVITQQLITFQNVEVSRPGNSSSQVSSAGHLVVVRQPLSHSRLAHQRQSAPVQ